MSSANRQAPGEAGWSGVLAVVTGALLLQLLSVLYTHSRAAFDPRALVANAFLNLGLALLVAHRYHRRRRERFAASGVVVVGKVVQRRSGGGSGNARQIEVEYADVTGATHRVWSSGAATSAPAVGEAATVFYQPGDPAGGRLEFDWKLQSFAFGLFAAIGIGIGVVVIVIETLRVAIQS